MFTQRLRAARLARALISAGAGEPPQGERRTDWVRVRVRMGGTYRRLRPEGHRWYAYSTIDLSPGGAALECAGEPLDVGDVLLVRLDPRPEFGLEGMQLRAEVRNRRANWSIYGIQWTRLTPEQQEQLIRFTLRLEYARLDFEQRSAAAAADSQELDTEEGLPVGRTRRRSFPDA